MKFRKTLGKEILFNKMLVEKKIAAYVDDNGIKQSFIVSRTGYAQPKVSKILRCEQDMTADEFVCICNALRQSPMKFMDDLITYNDEEQTNVN